MSPVVLRSFVALAETKHFGDTARLLNLSQPALTKQIRRLEDDLGAPLFERDGRGKRLTPFGEFFLGEAKPLLRQINEAYDRSRRAARGEAGRLMVGFSYSTVDVVSRAMPQFRQRFPDVEIELHDLSSAEQIRRIREDTLHVGFVRRPASADLAFQPILSDCLVLVVPASLAERVTGAHPEELGDLPLVLLHRERAPGLHDFVMQFCSARGLHPRKIHYTNEALIALSLVAAEVGVALLHRSVLGGLGEGVVVYALDGPDVAWDVGITWAADRANLLSHNFVELVKAQFAPEVPAAPGSVRVARA